ncbi:ABC transporter ATP-binding protein [Arthrobacter sp. ISL-69]|uniref:ABC transporter ATP-binding protein n=1 Tax=Arthrobacter sp. ISL-69 TaxID=2819113 RepID=UPI0028893AAF|nr:ABC transporter ATP-binding protein [Arthrobacter sp. ISL-69]
MGSAAFHALKGVSLNIAERETLAIVGASGSGKSTLLHMLGGLDTPDSGEVIYRGENFGKLKQTERNRIRNKDFGFVFQSFFLEANSTVQENVEMPLMIAKVKNRRKRVLEALDRLGLADRIDDRVAGLSGGQKQRVAIARAMINKPAVIFADEPTGSLDSKNGALVSDLLFELNEQDDAALVIVTHSHELASRCSREIAISDGILNQPAQLAAQKAAQ